MLIRPCAPRSYFSLFSPSVTPLWDNRYLNKQIMKYINQMIRPANNYPF